MYAIIYNVIHTFNTITKACFLIQQNINKNNPFNSYSLSGTLNKKFPLGIIRNIMYSRLIYFLFRN